jgi:hypothetical protein
MPNVQRIHTKRGQTESVAVFIEGERPLNTSNTHWSFQRILTESARLEAKSQDGDEPTVQETADLKALFSPEDEVNRRFSTLGERVKVRDGVIFIDGDAVDNALADQILRFREEGLDFEPLVKFYENLLQNTDDSRPEAAENSRQQLYRFLAANNFAITTDGMILAYKGVHSYEDEDGVTQYTSTQAGPAIVNGTPHEGEDVLDPETGETTHVPPGKVPQPIGGVIEMPRSSVTFDPHVHCSDGLHVAHYSYADSSAYGDYGIAKTILEVLVHPRDVVSVPTDYSGRKMRVCRYTVLGLAYGERTDALVLPTPAEPPAPEPEEDVVVEGDGTTHFNTSNLGGEGFGAESVEAKPIRKQIKRLRDFLAGR